MQNFSHLLLLTLMHSLWQSAILLVAVTAYKHQGKFTHPAGIRKMAASAILLQFVLSVVTFLVLMQSVSFVKGISIVPSIPGIPQQHETLAVYIYFFIVFILISKSTASWFIFRRSVRSGLHHPSEEIQIFVQQASAKLGIKRSVQLFLSEKVSVPLTFGFIKPVILIPIALVNRLSVDEMEAILIHELEHIRSADSILNRIVVLAENIFFFNPAIWYLTRELKRSREMNCDTVVLDHHYDLPVYAHALYQSAHLLHTSQRFALASTGKSRGELKNRITSMRDNYSYLKKRKTLMPLFFTMAIIAACILLINHPVKQRVFVQRDVASLPIAQSVSIQQEVPPIAPKVEEQKQIKKLQQPKTRSNNQPVASKTDEASQEVVKHNDIPIADGYQIVPVGNMPQWVSKNVIITEEDSHSGTKTISNYRFTPDSTGHYEMNLLWKVTQMPTPDSLRYLHHGDSTVIYLPETPADM